MASKKIKITVGIFVFAGIALTAISVIWLGMSRFLEKGRYYVAYFNESVQGLDKDSAVKYRGVPIGRVESIEVAPDSKLIEVLLKIETEQSLEKGIVAQLKYVGITGIMFIELDQKKPYEPDRTPFIQFPLPYPLVASKPSDISELFKGLDDLMRNIRSLDLPGISYKTKDILDKVDQSLADANVKEIAHGVERSLEDLQEILSPERWNHLMSSINNAGDSLNTLLLKGNGVLDRIEDVGLNADGMISDARQAVSIAFDDLHKTMERTNQLLEKGSSLASRTDDTLITLKDSLQVAGQNLEKASDSLNRVLKNIETQPSQMLFGEPPLPREVEKEREDSLPGR